MNCNQIMLTAIQNVRAKRDEIREANKREHDKLLENKDYALLNAQFYEIGNELLFGRIDKTEAERKYSQLSKQCSEIAQKENHKKYQTRFFCEKCKDTGQCGSVYCECIENEYKRLMAEELNRSSSLGRNGGFEAVNLNFYGVYIPLMTAVLQCCKMYAESFSSASGNIFMYGGTGLGKTHFSLSIAQTVIEKGYSVIYYSSLELFRIISDEHFKKDKDFYEQSTMETVTSSDLLVLDDLGVEIDNKFYKSCLYEILERRINAGLPMIINSNLDIKGICDKYGERVSSRISAFMPLEFRGNDIRQLKRYNG